MLLNKKKYLYQLNFFYRRLRKFCRQKETRRLAKQISLIFLLIVAVVVIPNFFKGNSPLSSANFLGDKAQQAIAFINSKIFRGPTGTNIKTDTPVIKQIKPENKFSRITFFFNAPYMASLAIPERWEGKYQTEETASSVDFLYAPPKQSTKPLFTIRLFKASDQSIKNLEIIKKIDNQIFTLNIPLEKVEGVNNIKEYETMKSEIRAIISSFRTHQQQP